MVLSQGNASPQGTLAMSGDIFTFFVVAVGWVGAAWGSCSTFYKAQDSPPPQAIVLPQMSLMPRLRIPGPEKTELCSSRWGQGRPLERDI